MNSKAKSTYPKLNLILFLTIAGLILLFNVAWMISRLKSLIPSSASQTPTEPDTETNEANEDLDGDFRLTVNQWPITGDNETGFPMPIVPDIVHYVLFNINTVTFAHFISIRSVLTNHQPDAIMIHCNCRRLVGRYWNRLKRMDKNGTKLLVNTIRRRDTIFGIPLSGEFLNWHASDIARIEVLMKFGGIYLDVDVYVVQSLKKFLKYEMTVPWNEDQNMGNYVMVAHRRARFLPAYLETYRYYDPSKWYYNAGQLPTASILTRYPNLVHRVNDRFGVDGMLMCPYLFLSDQDDWQTRFDVIHLFIRGNKVCDWCLDHRLSLEFGETSVRTSRTTFGQMVRLLLHGTKELLPINRRSK